MNIFLFDTDGVLLKPKGYHRALKETVRLAGISTGFGEVLLDDGQIAQFKALGISSEWHSSALCMAVMRLEQYRERSSKLVPLNLDRLFEVIAAQPMQHPALARGLAAIENFAVEYNVSASLVRGLVAESESINQSPTLNTFQELILGSEIFENTYYKKSKFQTESYLKLYDKRLLSESMAAHILVCQQRPDYGVAIMTNRPSSGPSGFAGAPDAEMGAALVGLVDLPLVGYGEISWLAEQTNQQAGELEKPAWQHALAAILMASGCSIEACLQFICEQPLAWPVADYANLQGSTITVFEDTPGGHDRCSKGG